MRIKNWETFQHYKQGSNALRVTWIKVYVQLLDDREWCALSGDAARFLLMLWLMAADSDGEIGSPDDIAWRLRMAGKEVGKLLSEVSDWIDDPDGFLPRKEVGSLPRQDDETLPRKDSESLPSTKRREEKREEIDMDAFEVVWSTHRRGSKAKAIEEYRKAVPKKITHESLIEALAAYVSGFRDDFQGAHLERWIRDERWEEYDPDAMVAADELRGAEAARWV
jgi:hypothetical protein